MVKSKKILSLALALVMALGVLTMGVFAAKTTPTATFTVSSSASDVANGDEVTITVKANATETFYAGPMSLPIEYNASLFEYVADSATVANIYGESTTKSAVKAEAGKLTVALTPSTSGAVTAPDLNGANLTVLTFKLKAIGSTGSSTVAIADDQKTAANIGGKFYCGSFDSANPKTAELTEMGQTLNRVSATISYKGGAVEPNKLVIKDSAPSTPYIDKVNKADGYTASIYGIDTLGWNDDLTPEGALADYLTTSLGDNYLRITKPESGVETTGTVIEVLDADGKTVLETYIFIYFGDVDEDGNVGSSDDFIVSYYEANYEGVSTLEQLMAGDIDGDGWSTAADGFTMTYYESAYSGLPSQQEIAAKVNANTYELI